jgi:acetolactate synthase-like protein
MNGGRIIARVLQAQGVKVLFTLCGGHISPILIECKRAGLRVVDTRHEATAVFAADAVARLTGVPGVAAVTAGPGVTNTLTAVQNARLAQSPVVLLGGATATVLRNRGALQDIDQLALIRSSVKWAARARRVRDLEPLLHRALRESMSGTPGPVFLECPIDLLYDEPMVRQLYASRVDTRPGAALADRAIAAYLRWHLDRQFAGLREPAAGPELAAVPRPPAAAVAEAARRLGRAQRPLLVIGSQALLDVAAVPALREAVERLGVPAYLSGMARGLLGAAHPLLLRHKRREALREADLVILAGVPCDFRLDYGAHIRRAACLVAANRDRRDLYLNRRPQVAVRADAGAFLQELAAAAPARERPDWRAALQAREDAREAGIAAEAATVPAAGVNPLQLLRQLDAQLPEDSLLVADGGDFVATASYIVRPRGPLRWLDPGVYGTLGVGAGFALGAALCRVGAVRRRRLRLLTGRVRHLRAARHPAGGRGRQRCLLEPDRARAGRDLRRRRGMPAAAFRLPPGRRRPWRTRPGHPRARPDRRGAGRGARGGRPRTARPGQRDPGPDRLPQGLDLDVARAAGAQ